jgi:hypothetical protein
MIVSVFVRRLKEGCTFEDFVRGWEADEGFGVPTRVFNAHSLDDPRNVISIGFVAVAVDVVAQGLAASAAAPEAVRHDRISTVIESTKLRACTRSGPSTTSPWNRRRSPSIPLRVSPLLFVDRRTTLPLT